MRKDTERFVVHADEKLIAFVEPESVIRAWRIVFSQRTRVGLTNPAITRIILEDAYLMVTDRRT